MGNEFLVILAPRRPAEQAPRELKGRKSIGKKTPDKNSIGNVTKFARAGALSSLGERLEIARPIDKNNIPPNNEKNRIFIHANMFPCPTDKPRTNTPIRSNIIV